MKHFTPSKDMILPKSRLAELFEVRPQGSGHKGRRAAAGASVLDVSFLTSNGGPFGSTTHSHTSLSFGAAAANRHIIVCVSYEHADNRTISSMTVGGVYSATRAAQSTASAAQANCEIWIAAVPTGTSGTVAVTFSGSTSRSAVSLYRAIGLSSATPTATAADNAHTANLMDVSLNTPSGKSIVIATVCDRISGQSVTYAGVTGGADFVYDSGAHHSSGSHLSTGAETPRTVTGTFGVTPNNERSCSAVFQ